MELFKLFGRVLVEVTEAINDLTKVDDKADEAAKGLKKVDKAAEDASNNASKYAELLEKFGRKIAAAFTVTAISGFIQKIWDVSDAVAAQGDAIDKASQKLGVSAQFYQEWSYILERNGTSIDAVGEGIFELSEKVAKADEGVAAAFESLGISMNEMMVATPEEIFESAIIGLMNIDSEAERARISTTLFGDKAKQLGPLLNTSAEDIEALKDKVHELGGVMSDDLVKKSADYADAVTNLKTAWQGFKNDLAENTIPGMTNVVNGFTTMLTGDFIPGLELAGSGIASFFEGCLETLYSYTESVWAEIAEMIEKAQYSLGGLFGLSKEEVDAGVDAYYNEEFQLPSGEWVTQSQLDDRFHHANGLLFVPRDNYPANLHYGERVLTRQEAAEYNSGKSSGGGGFNQTVNISTVTTSPAQTAAAVRAAFETARWSV